MFDFKSIIEALFELHGDDYFESLFMKDLGRDESYLRIINNGSQIPVFLLQSHKECLECDFYKKGMIYAEENYKVKSSYRYLIAKREFNVTKNEILCDFSEEKFGEFGVYDAIFNETNCSFQTSKEPVNIYLPILTVFLIYFLATILILFAFKIRKKFQSSNAMNATVEPSTNLKVEQHKSRIKSLDTFRGLSIVIMIFVNVGAGGYEIFEHAVWNGLHLADFVFPCFLWIMGTCIPISLASSFKKNISNETLMKSVGIRSLKLFCLGVFLNSGIYLYKFRIMGVLQRFGICYYIVSVICIFLLKRKFFLNPENSKVNAFSNIKATMLAWIPVGCFAAFHLLITFLVSDENCEKGYLGPGGFHKHGKFKDCTGGATGFLDRAILGRHAYQNPTCYEAYHSQYFDPEGVIATLNSIFHTFIGVQSGVILLIHRDHKSRIVHWLFWAISTGILGGILCKFSVEDGWIPVNKNLWSLSFVFITSSTAFLLLAVFYFLIDVKKWWRGQPFFYAGMNSILMYVGHEILTGFFPFSWEINDYDTKTHFLFLLENFTTTVLWILIAYYLYKIKYFLTV